MGLLKEISCSECGEKTNIAMRMKLMDGNYLCHKCKKIIPGYIIKYATKNYTLEDYKFVKEWVVESVKKYGSAYSETHSYGFIDMDSNKGLFRIVDGIWNNKSTPILEFSNVADFDFSFRAKEYKDGILGGKVKGEAMFFVTMKEPQFYYEAIIDSNATAEAKKGFFGKKVTFEHPKRMQEFEQAFICAYLENSSNAVSSERDMLEQSMSLFMIDDISAIDIRGLEEVKSKLLASFQEKEKEKNIEKNIEKINKAFDVLKDKVAK